ncbi:transmembrane protein 170A isoform 2-T2 [Trichechus inunguis]
MQFTYLLIGSAAEHSAPYWSRRDFSRRGRSPWGRVCELYATSGAGITLAPPLPLIGRRNHHLAAPLGWEEEGSPGRGDAVAAERCGMVCSCGHWSPLSSFMSLLDCWPSSPSDITNMVEQLLEFTEQQERK